MTEEHKQALAVGRAEGRMVRAYLEALESSRPKRGRKRTKESISRRLERIEAELEAADPLKRLQLTQEQIDLTEELESMDNGVNIADLENDFVRVAQGYAERKGITYQAFRQIGVPASVLKRAGISRAA
ncbi:MAG: hypothetical protein OER95_00230 [Acidimicrobiia bacterium]|nr:hypothetical protein [Acidimicrobiia bacterium]